MILYDTLSQPFFIFVLFLVGFACGFLVDIRTLILKKIKHGGVYPHLIDFVIVVICFFSLYLTNLTCHYGIIRLFPVVVFSLAFGSQRFISKKVFAKLARVCYNLLKRKKYGAKKS